jgi:DinB superfamily
MASTNVRQKSTGGTTMRQQSAASADGVSTELSLLLRILDEGYEKKAWHGPNLKGAVRGLDASAADWRPHPARHSIVENVVHCAYWKYAVRRRLTGEKRGSFSLKGSNWFTIVSPIGEATWKGYTALLDREHRALRETIAAFPPARLAEFPKGGKVRFITQIYGVALHDVYHAGQIQLLKRLREISARS